MLRCEECGAEPRFVLDVRDVKGILLPFTLAYCRACTEREFGPEKDVSSARISVEVRRPDR